MKLKKIVIALLIALCCAALLVGCAPEDNQDNYLSKVDAYTAPDGSPLMQNKSSEAYAQTAVHDIVMSHFDAPLADGKTKKKAIFIGYDGCRVDVLNYAADHKDSSALLAVRDMGTLVYAYAGGENGDQTTSTAPGWASMLTGKWANGEGGHGVADNGDYKKTEVETFLTKLARNNHTASFTTSWRHHQSVTYFNDIQQSIVQNLPVTYTHCEDDQATYYDVLSRAVAKEGFDTDVMFLTLEGTDHNGHDFGFGIQHPEYIKGFKEEDEYAYQLINAIKSRQNYDKEDWLIVLATDHGGYKTGHGGQTVLERTTWIATSHPQYLPA